MTIRNIFLLMLPVSLSLASCSNRQQHYGGPIEPIYSIPLTSSQQVIEIHSGGPAIIRRTAGRRHLIRHRHGTHLAVPAGTDVHYPHVLTDPVPPPKGKAGQTSTDASQASELDTFAVAGTWAVTGTKDGCKVALLSTKVIDLQKANATGCDGTSLAGVTGWRKFGRNGIELVQHGGKSAAKFVESSPTTLMSVETADQKPLQLKG